MLRAHLVSRVAEEELADRTLGRRHVEPGQHFAQARCDLDLAHGVGVIEGGKDVLAEPFRRGELAQAGIGRSRLVPIGP